MLNGDEASPSIILAGCAIFVKRLITLELHGIFSSNLLAYTALNCLDTGLQNKNNASPSFSIAGLG